MSYMYEILLLILRSFVLESVTHTALPARPAVLSRMTLAVLKTPEVAPKPESAVKSGDIVDIVWYSLVRYVAVPTSNIVVCLVLLRGTCITKY